MNRIARCSKCGRTMANPSSFAFITARYGCTQIADTEGPANKKCLMVWVKPTEAK